jgi:endo-1,4-beta-mannosidase
MDFENLKEGQPIQNPPLFEKENFLEWKSKFENYVKSIDQDLWHVISIGDFKPTKTSFENQDDYPKLDKNTKAKIMIYKALPSTEYERIYFCQTANDIWKNMLNFHQELCQVKDDQFDLTYELEVLEKLIDRHLVEINSCVLV